MEDQQKEKGPYWDGPRITILIVLCALLIIGFFYKRFFRGGNIISQESAVHVPAK